MSSRPVRKGRWLSAILAKPAAAQYGEDILVSLQCFIWPFQLSHASFVASCSAGWGTTLSGLPFGAARPPTYKLVQAG